MFLAVGAAGSKLVGRLHYSTTTPTTTATTSWLEHALAGSLLGRATDRRCLASASKVGGCSGLMSFFRGCRRAIDGRWLLLMLTPR